MRPLRTKYRDDLDCKHTKIARTMPDFTRSDALRDSRNHPLPPCLPWRMKHTIVPTLFFLMTTACAPLLAQPEPVIAPRLPGNIFGTLTRVRRSSSPPWASAGGIRGR